MNGPVYLDWNATAPVCDEALAEMLDTLRHAWANPSSTHAPGQAARRVLADARARVATALGAQTAELVFTSGATEANHQAVLGALAAQPGRKRLVLSAVEHPGLLALAQRLRAQGTPVDLIPVDREGRLDLWATHALITASDVAAPSRRRRSSLRRRGPDRRHTLRAEILAPEPGTAWPGSRSSCRPLPPA